MAQESLNLFEISQRQFDVAAEKPEPTNARYVPLAPAFASVNVKADVVEPST